MGNLLNINLYNITIIVGSLQGLIFSLIVLLNPKYKSNSNFYLSLLIITISLNNFYYWCIDTQLIQNLELYKLFYIPWALLITPMYYYFVKSYLSRKKIKFSFRNFLLFPFLFFLSIHFITSVYNYFFQLEENIYSRIMEKLYYFEEYFSVAFTILIIIITYKKIKLYEKNNINYNKENVVIETIWLKKILYFGVFISIIWLSMVLYNHINSYALFSNKIRYFLWISNSFLIYYLGYLGIYYNGIFKERNTIRKNIGHNRQKQNSISNGSKFDEIKNIIEQEKLFLNPNLNLNLIAKKLELNESYFSHLFNQNSTKNFTSYINTIRIKEAKKLLTNKDFSNYTIVSIGLESGFNSKSAFYNAFKKETGITPTEYRKTNMS